MYVIIDKQTGNTVGKSYQTTSKAGARRDKLDNEYRAYRYVVKFVEAV